jgi:membrane associated rhomboid family serine protease
VTALFVAISVVLGAMECSFLLLDRAELISHGHLWNLLALQPGAVHLGRLWQFVSFAGLHAGPLHLAGNVLALYFAGREVEPIIGARHFSALYLLAIFVGGVADWCAMLAGWLPADACLVGVSAGVAAVLVAYATILPELEVSATVLFVLPVRVRAKVFGVGCVALAALLWLWEPGSPTGPPAILAGAFVGWVYIKRLGFGNPLAIERYLFEKRQHAARIDRMPADQFIIEEIDPILEKISREGAGRLTRAERKLLEKGREKLSARDSRE